MHSVSLQIDTHILHYLLFLEKIPGPGFIKRIEFFFFTKVSTIFNSSYIYNAMTRLKLKLPLKCSSDRPFGLRGP